MQNIIQLLPDVLANQIAAGEVVQRPASVVKELMENAVDAGARRIDVLIKEAGKTLIQITDDGSGMSSADARMSFERHATSKIREEKDLFSIHTLGFRGEALASIAAVAQVKLRTRQHDAELGTEIEIAGSKLSKQEVCVCPAGTTLQIKNLFFNVPARRNFLRSNPVETRHILNEFTRIALSYPTITMTLTHNDTEVYHLLAGTMEERIILLLGEEYRGKLIPVEEKTGYLNVKGFIGDPSIYKLKRGEQFFFVNGRFIKSSYLHHAVSQVYHEFIPKDSFPFYVIFLEIDPVHVDINIHPTKTEVKFDDERTIYALLQSVVKQGMSGHHQVPELDLTDQSLKETIYSSTPPPVSGEVTLGQFSSMPGRTSERIPSRQNWDNFYQPPKENVEEQKPKQEESYTLIPFQRSSGSTEPTILEQLQNTYILTEREGKLYIIHQYLAHQRILYERFINAYKEQPLDSQQLLFPQTYTYSPSEYTAIMEAEGILARMGFEVKEFGPNTIAVYGTPTEIPLKKIGEIFDQIIADIQEVGATQVPMRFVEGIARAVSLRSAVTSGQKLSKIELTNIVQDLFKCEVPSLAPNGTPSFKVISTVELEEYFG